MSGCWWMSLGSNYCLSRRTFAVLRPVHSMRISSPLYYTTKEHWKFFVVSVPWTNSNVVSFIAVTSAYSARGASVWFCYADVLLVMGSTVGSTMVYSLYSPDLLSSKSY